MQSILMMICRPALMILKKKKPLIAQGELLTVLRRGVIYEERELTH